jgi:transposase
LAIADLVFRSIRTFARPGQTNANIKNPVTPAKADAMAEMLGWTAPFTASTMRFVPVKTAEQQAALTMLGVRDLLVKQRTMLINAMRGHAAEFGVTAAKSLPSPKRRYPTRKPFARAGTSPRGTA